MRSCLYLIACILLASCSSSGDGNGGGNGNGPASCSNTDQKRYVRDVISDWYLWNDLLPNNISVNNYDSPAELLADMMTYSPDDGSGNPVDRFSFIGSAQADAAFFGEGQFVGFGFSRKGLAVDDIRITQVFANSPAAIGGLARGQRFLELNGRSVSEIQAAEGIDAVLLTTPLTFLMQEPGGAQLTTTIAHDLVTIDPVPQYRVIPANDGTGRMIGYVELVSFIGTADAALDSVFADFVANGVNDVILDMRYNGGGLVSTANWLGDLLGGDVAENLVFSETRFNADRAANNNSTNLFTRLNNSMSLSRLIVIGSERTASASELVTNSMAPHVEVTIIGDTTFGKPIGQGGFEFCEQILRLTAFQTVNSEGFGDYFDGIPVNCPVADDLAIALGADADPNIITALAYLANGQCPVVAMTEPAAKQQAARQMEMQFREALRGAPAWREFAGAF